MLRYGPRVLTYLQARIQLSTVQFHKKNDYILIWSFNEKM